LSLGFLRAAPVGPSSSGFSPSLNRHYNRPGQRVRDRQQPARRRVPPPAARLPRARAGDEDPRQVPEAGLEDEKFDVLPAPTYVKGFLRNYADALGLEGPALRSTSNNSRFVTGDEGHSAGRPRDYPTAPRQALGPRFESRAVLLALRARIAVAVRARDRRLEVGLRMAIRRFQGINANGPTITKKRHRTARAADGAAHPDGEPTAIPGCSCADGLRLPENQQFPRAPSPQGHQLPFHRPAATLPPDLVLGKQAAEPSSRGSTGRSW